MNEENEAPPVPAEPKAVPAEPKPKADPPGDASIPAKLDDSAEGRVERKKAAKTRYLASPPKESRAARKDRSP